MYIHTHTHRETDAHHTHMHGEREDYLYYTKRFTVEHWFFVRTWRMASPNSAGQARDPGRN